MLLTGDRAFRQLKLCRHALIGGGRNTMAHVRFGNRTTPDFNSRLGCFP